MRNSELIAQLQKLPPDAHVEVLGHDGSWSWVSEASVLRLGDTEGVTETVVIHVMNSGVRQPTQPIGKPPTSSIVSHIPTVQDWAEMKEKH